MPLFKGRSSKARPAKAIAYITDPQKAALVDGLNLGPASPEGWTRQFEQTARRFGKDYKMEARKYYHFKLSPDPRDGVSPEACQAAALELTKTLLPDFECVVATHTDTGVVHSHVVVNAVSFADGHKLHAPLEWYRAAKDLANDIGKKYGMTELDWRDTAKVKRAKLALGEALPPVETEKRIALRGGVGWKDELREVIDLALSECESFVEFEDYLEKYGVTLPRNTEKTLSYLHPQKERAIRGERLGEKYTAAAVSAFFAAKVPDAAETRREEAYDGPELPPGTAKDKAPWYAVDVLPEEGLSDKEIRELRQSYIGLIELRLAVRNSVYDASDYQSFLQILNEDYGVTVRDTPNGERFFHPDGLFSASASDVGDEYVTKEAIENVIAKQGDRANRR